MSPHATQRADTRPTPPTRTPQPATRRALMVTPRWTFLPGDDVAPTPADALTGGLPPLLARMARTMPDGGVCILDARSAIALGLPHRAEDIADSDTSEHPAIVDARRAGWSVSRVRPFTDFYGEGRPRLTFCILSLVDFTRAPVMCTSPHDTISALTMWHNAMGTPYSGTPGSAGITALRESLAQASKQPLWRPKESGPTAEELPFLAEHFHGAAPRGSKYRIGYDAKFMYLSAQSIVPVGTYGLKNTGALTDRDPRAVGWFLIDLTPWQGDLAKRLPNPAGHNTPTDDGKVWVTAPTLSLLDELVAAGEHGGYSIVDSWTTVALPELSWRLLKPWAERIRDGLYTEGAGPDFYAFQTALKGAYRESNGMLASPASRIYRPDWHSAVIAQARCNLWRKMREIGEQLKRWPLSIDTDCVWYAARTENFVDECPTWRNEDTGKQRGIILGRRLGTFSVKSNAIRPIGAVKRGAK